MLLVANTIIQQRKTNSLATQNLVAKTGSLLTPQFDNENWFAGDIEFNNEKWFAGDNVFGRNRQPTWATADSEIIDENQVATDLEIVNAAQFMAEAKIVEENWVAADLEIINTTPVAADSEISIDDEVVFGITSSLQPNVRLMLGFPLPMFLTLGGYRTSPNHTPLSSNNTNINTCSFRRFSKFIPSNIDI